MAFVIARKGEDIERLLKRFNNKVSKHKILAEIKKRSYFQPPSQVVRIKMTEARRKILKNMNKENKRSEQYD